jgi:hypothetical protein
VPPETLTSVKGDEVFWPTGAKVAGEVPEKIVYSSIGNPFGGIVSCHEMVTRVLEFATALTLVGAAGIGGVVAVTVAEGGEVLPPVSSAVTSQ